jgi:hypothetical protein
MCRLDENPGSSVTLQRLTIRVGLLVVLLLASGALVGCFNADAMIESRRVVAVRKRLVEVDLGEYRVTLPQAAKRTESPELHFHVFGQVANRDLDDIEEMLEKKGPEIRHDVLIVARMMTIEDLEDPKLAALRSRISQVVNDSLEGEPVQEVGFYRFGYMHF